MRKGVGRPQAPLGHQRPLSPLLLKNGDNTNEDAGDADDVASQNYEEEADLHTAKGLNAGAFRWLLTANARADIRFQNTTSTLDKQRLRVRNAIERQQRALASKSQALQALLGAKKTITKPQPNEPLLRPSGPTPNEWFARRPRSASCDLPAVDADGGQHLRSRSDYDLYRASMPELKRSERPAAKVGVRSRASVLLKKRALADGRSGDERADESDVVFVTKLQSSF